MGLKQIPDATKVVTTIPRSLKDRFKPATQLRAEKSKGFKVTVAGRSKVGKTEFALSAPLPIYLIDTEGSVEQNLKNPKYAAIADKIHVFDVMKETPIGEDEDIFDPVASLDELLQGVTDITNAIARHELEEGTRGTIVIDSGTDVWGWLVQWLEDMEGITENQDSAGKIMRTKWGKPNKRYMNFVRKLLKSDWNVVCTFRVQDAVDKKGADLGYDKARQQKDTDYFFDCITELKREGTARYMYFKPIRGVGDITIPLENPTFPRLLAHLKQHAGVDIA